MTSLTIDLSKPIELSHTAIPEEEEYHLEIDARFTEEWPQFEKYERADDAWYIISEVTLNTHCSTHIEFPYHHFRDGADAAEFPVERLVGEGIVLDISRWRANNSKITLADLKEVARDRIRPGNHVFFYTGNDEYYYTGRQHDRPWFTTECIEWLVTRGIGLMGVDTSGHEVRGEDGVSAPGQPNHEVLLGAGIPLVEYLTNLDALLGRRFASFVLPVKISGADAFPVRVVAFEVVDEEASSEGA
ncbi:MAG: cyclase family protein [Anaerolineae bacterium]|jgi:arylformamidase